MGTFPARVCCLPLAAGVGRLARRCPACVLGGKQWLVKTFTAGKYWQAGRCWQAGKYWERCRRRSGTGGYVFPRITAVSGALYFCENNGISAGQRRQHLTIHIENVIISVTMITKKLFVTRRAKMPLQAVLPPAPIKSH